MTDAASKVTRGRAIVHEGNEEKEKDVKRYRKSEG